MALLMKEKAIFETQRGCAYKLAFTFLKYQNLDLTFLVLF